ncbi:MAG: NAD(P)/FAD-dependent oxidoreductase [Chitinophagaceae bacterium]
MPIPSHSDVIIIGGSYAGLSAAMALGRSLRKTLVIDSGSPCNRFTPHSHNFLTQDGKPPAEISTSARQQVAQYDTVRFYEGEVLGGTETDDGFAITTGSGDTFTGTKLIFATGINDQLPEMPGFADCWGKSVIHCPYCHGYEFRGRKTGILANGDRAFHLASLVNNLTSDLSVVTNGQSHFTEEQTARLQQRSIPIFESGIAGISHRDGQIQNLVFDDGTVMLLEALYASVPFVQHTDIPLTLGCDFNKQGYIQVDEFQKTTVPGVFACGDNSSMMRSVANAVATGNFTGAMVNRELTEELF